jgi:hypothetical protein
MIRGSYADCPIVKQGYLQITYRKGRARAAYDYLPGRDDDRSARTEQLAGGIVVDFTSDGRAIGIEITSPTQLDVKALNKGLAQLGLNAVPPDDLAPLIAT